MRNFRKCIYKRMIKNILGICVNGVLFIGIGISRLRRGGVLIKDFLDLFKFFIMIFFSYK